MKNNDRRNERELKRKERPGYNSYYNKTVLETLDLIIENDDVWLSSIELANISGRNHKHVLRDIERDILSIYDHLGLHSPTLDDNLRKLRDVSNFGPVTKETQSDDDVLTKIIHEVNDIISDNDDKFDEDVLKGMKVKTKYRLTDRGRFRYYLLNREVSLMCLMRYSPVVRVYVSNLFFKTVDMLKSKGNDIKSAKDMFVSIDDAINNDIERLESDLEEDGLLSEFNMWHLVWLLFRKIPKSIAKYFSKEFPQFYEMYDSAVRHGDFSSPYFDDPDKKYNK